MKFQNQKIKKQTYLQTTQKETPKIAPTSITHQPGNSGGFALKLTRAGRAAKPVAYGTAEQTVALSPALYANPEIKNTTCQSPTRGLMLTDNAIDSVVAVITIAHAVVRGIAPATSGLSARPARRSRSTSTMSLLKPIAIWFRKTATTTTTACAGATPKATASSNVSSVTAKVGTGWLDRRTAPITTIGPID